ncbi:hypothetical protein NKJ52_31350 [Mesorhizobium australicum]
MLVSDASTSPKKRTSLPAGIRNCDGVPQLCDVNSDKCFPKICHGSSSCDEDRLGPPEQPPEAQCRGATSPAEADIRSYNQADLLTKEVAKVDLDKGTAGITDAYDATAFPDNSETVAHSGRPYYHDVNTVLLAFGSCWPHETFYVVEHLLGPELLRHFRLLGSACGRIDPAACQFGDLDSGGVNAAAQLRVPARFR